MMAVRYFLTRDDSDEKEVTKEEFVHAERAAGFKNTMGFPDEPATASFGASNVSGRVQYR